MSTSEYPDATSDELGDNLSKREKKKEKRHRPLLLSKKISLARRHVFSPLPVENYLLET